MASSPIKGILFDLDGTIVDVPYDWDRIREELDTGGRPILSYISQLPEPLRKRKWEMLEGFEAEATEEAVLKPGIGVLMEAVLSSGVKTALISNNSRKNVDILLERFGLRFDLVMARETGLWKPSGAPFRFALSELGLRSDEACVIGDSRFDILAAKDAGIQRIFILSDHTGPFEEDGVELFSSVEDLTEEIRPLMG